MNGKLFHLLEFPFKPSKKKLSIPCNCELTVLQYAHCLHDIYCKCNKRSQDKYILNTVKIKRFHRIRNTWLLSTNNSATPEHSLCGVLQFFSLQMYDLWGEKSSHVFLILYNPF